MEVEETERIVIAKPVASRPNCSRFRSFSGLLAGAIESPCSSSFPELIDAAIRPKTVRFRPAAVGQITTSPAVSSQAEIPQTMTCDPASEDLKSQGIMTVIYKPKAKLRTRPPISLPADTESFHTSRRPALSSRAEAPHIGDFVANVQSSVTRAETNRTAPRCLVEEDNRSLNSTSHADGTSYDGYNWRKYGQKQVKGSECPRSYYKCTHPNCPVKKKVERSFDGQIAEIVYKGEHSHAKPLPPELGSLGTHTRLGTVLDDSAGRSPANYLGADCFGEGNKCRIENHNTIGSSWPSTYHGKGLLRCKPDTSCGPSSGFDEGIQQDAPRSKRRKSECRSSEAGILCEGIQQNGHVMVQSSTNTDPSGDGFRWRKYGQKVVKGSPYPRSYYRCTSLKCTVRKHIERASDDPTLFVTTYEGKHNHEMPTSSGHQ